MGRTIVRAGLMLLVCAVALAGASVAGATPINLSPANGAALAQNAQAFSWGDNAVQGPVDHWYMEISTSPQVDYYPWGFFSGGLVYASGHLTTSSVSLNALGRALTPGTYYWHVGGYYGPFGSLGTAWSNVQSFTVRSASATAPTIAVNPSSFSFDVEYNDPTWHAADLAISNSGGGTLSFLIPTFGVNWLGAAPGSNTGIVYTLPIAVRPFSDAGATTPMSPGTYSTNITIQDNGSSPAATNSPKLVPVTMHVYATDNAAPTGASVTIAGGQASTGTVDVTLTCAAADTGSGMGEMRFANVAGQWTNWLPYATIKTWILATGDGTKTVYAQYRDRVGNESAVVSDTIVLDQTRPVTKAPYSVTVRRGMKAALRYRVNDAAPNGGTAKATIRIKTLRGKTVKTLKGTFKPVNTTQKITFRCKLAKGRYKFYVYAVDRAGNTQSKIGSNRLTVK